MENFRSPGRIATLAIAFLSACASPATSDKEQDVVTTNLSVYTTGQDITVNYDGMSGAPTDWISLALTTDPDTTYPAWMYTGGGTSGSVTFVAPNLAPGTYEARAYYDWDGTQSFTVQQTSTSFVIGTGGPTISTDMTSYAPGQTVLVTYSGLPGNPTDWIAISADGSPDTSFVAWTYTNGNMSGQASFSNVAVGHYVARSYLDDGYTKAAESTPFTIGAGSVTVATTQPSYTPADPILVNYSGFSTTATDWITVVPAGSGPNVYDEWHYTNGATSGQMQFAALPVGPYEVRAFFNDSFVLVANSTFTVANAVMVSTNSLTYTTGQDVTLNFNNMPGNQKDWVAVSVMGSPDTSYVAWFYINGASMGSEIFSGLPANDYEARAYVNDSFTVLARSSFTITNPTASVAPASTYTSADPITINYSGFTLDATDWITVVPANAAPGTYDEWHYTTGASSGMMQFAALPAGDYEARAYFADGFTLAASADFTVTQ